VDDVAQRDDQQPGTDDADGEQDEEDAGEVQGCGSCWVIERSNGLADPLIRSASRPHPILAQPAGGTALWGPRGRLPGDVLSI